MVENFEDRRSSQSSHVNKSSRDALRPGVNSLLVDQCQIDTLQRKELTEERTKVRKMNEPAKSRIKEVFTSMSDLMQNGRKLKRQENTH